jgi:hypothetical protein
MMTPLQYFIKQKPKLHNSCIICFYRLKFMGLYISVYGPLYISLWASIYQLMGLYISVLIRHPADVNMFQNQNFCRHIDWQNHLTDTRKQTWGCEPYTGTSSFGLILSHNFVSHSNLFMLLLVFPSYYKCKWIGHIQWKDQSKGERTICFFLKIVVLLQIQQTVQIWIVNRCHGKFSYI